MGILQAFSSPAHSIAKTIVQTAGELDFEILFNDADLLYSPMAYILFFSFAILMPILFLNLLVSRTMLINKSHSELLKDIEHIQKLGLFLITVSVFTDLPIDWVSCWNY